MRPVLDACCGGRMFWFDKEDDRAVYMDCRRFAGTCCDGRSVSVDPDVLADFADMPFPDSSFRLVVLDPGGTLIFKWNEYQVPVAEVLALTDEKPLFGHRSGRQGLTHWICFLKAGRP